VTIGRSIRVFPSQSRAAVRIVRMNSIIAGE
jgi:hypothetical protein